MSFREEFGPEYAIPADVLNVLLALGWEDTSWHNDVCPTFERPSVAMRLWCDAERLADREMGTLRPRFVLEQRDWQNYFDDGSGDGWHVHWACEDVAECIRRLTKSEG